QFLADQPAVVVALVALVNLVQYHHGVRSGGDAQCLLDLFGVVGPPRVEKDVLAAVGHSTPTRRNPRTRPCGTVCCRTTDMWVLTPEGTATTRSGAEAICSPCTSSPAGCRFGA